MTFNERVAVELLGWTKATRRVRNVYEDYTRIVWVGDGDIELDKLPDFSRSMNAVITHVVPELRARHFGVMLTMERHSWIAQVYRPSQRDTTCASSDEDDFAARAICSAALKAIKKKPKRYTDKDVDEFMADNADLMASLAGDRPKGKG